jgi:hypothetical protein
MFSFPEGRKSEAVDFFFCVCFVGHLLDGFCLWSFFFPCSHAVGPPHVRINKQAVELGR